MTVTFFKCFGIFWIDWKIPIFVNLNLYTYVSYLNYVIIREGHGHGKKNADSAVNFTENSRDAKKVVFENSNGWNDLKKVSK